jgi:hypothetical protein
MNNQERICKIVEHDNALLELRREIKALQVEVATWRPILENAHKILVTEIERHNRQRTILAGIIRDYREKK